MRSTLLSFVLIFFIHISFTIAHENDDESSTKNARADSHAPINVMGDHLHKKGDWMFSYRYMSMNMKGMQQGTSAVNTNSVSSLANPLAGETMRMGDLANGSPRMMMVPNTYRIVPLEMDMKMHMLGAMYGWSDDITLMLMLPKLEKTMRLKTFGGMMGSNAIGNFTSQTSGIGDIKFSAMLKIFDQDNSQQNNAYKNRSDQDNQKIHATIGLSFPTGKITEKGEVLPPFAGMMIPAGEKVEIDRLAYPMQLGSGSYELLSGITLNDRKANLSWGAQLSTVIRLNENSKNYQLGNRLQITAWVAEQWQSWMSGSIRINAFSEGAIKGRDDSITGAMPLFVASNSGRDQIDINLGINLLGEDEIFKGHRLAAEIGIPVYQRVNGLQMESDWNFTLGWQKAF